MKKKTAIILIICFFVLLVCSAVLYRVLNAPAYSTEETGSSNYFPNETGISDFTNEWYSEQLSALGEPVLYSQANNPDKTIYRFTCLRTFDNPFSIRIEIDEHDKTAMLYFKMCDGAGGYSPGSIKIDEKAALNESQIDDVIDVFQKHDFWGLPFEGDDAGFDGSEWIIEMLENNKYHAITRWTPDDGEVYNLGILFIGLSGQQIQDLY